MKTAIAAALLLFLLPGAVYADVLYPDAITFGPTYAAGPPLGIPWGGPPGIGSPLTIVGVISSVSSPFTELLPAGPYELTVVYEGATCGEIGQFDGTCVGGTYWGFSAGSMSIYLDTSPDADFTNQSTFRDGELVLLAATASTLVMDADPWEGCPGMEDDPDVPSFITFTGGAWFSKVSHAGTGFNGMSKGELTGHNPDNVASQLQALGYVLRIDGSIDIFGPVATEPVTWGHVKSLYR